MNKIASIIILFLILLVILSTPTLADNVPSPSLPTSDYLVGSFYYPGWHLNPYDPWVDNGWLSINNFPNRKPLLGYYDEGNPEVTDWEIKWAAEHGINFFIIQWKRCEFSGFNSCATMLGKPINKDTLSRRYALNDGFSRATLRNNIKFAINMVDIIAHTQPFSTTEDLRDNLMPFLIDNYFKQSNYLVINNKPVLFLFEDLDGMAKAGGDPQKVKDMLNIMRQAAINSGFDDLIIMGHDWQFVNRNITPNQKLKEYGVDYSFSYVTPVTTVDGVYVRDHATEQQAIESQRQSYEWFKNTTNIPFIVTASPFWDSYPNTFNTTGNWYASPDGFKQIINNAKSIMKQSASDLGKRMIIVDAWNEYGEGHYIAPTSGFGFSYLQSIRETLTDKNNTPDYRLPQEHGMGPYESLYENYNTIHTKSYADVAKKTYLFNKPDDFIDVEDIGFNIADTNKLTFGGWIKSSLTATNNIHISKPSTTSIVLKKDGSGYCVFATKNNNAYSSGTMVSWPINTIAADIWHHIICIYDGSHVSVYIDGTKTATSTTAISGNLNNRLFRLRLGYYPDGWSAGAVSNFIFQNSILSDSQIQTLYQSTRPSSLSGDLNSDGKVDIFDYNIIVSKFGISFSILDFNKVVENFGK